MNATVKIIKIGNSSGVILPKEILAEFNVDRGDTLSVSRTTDGIALRPANSEFEAQMEIARKVMKKYRNALRELAK